MKSDMYIKKLQLLNFQVIKEFNAEFDGNVYFVTGDNELGKSTLLKAIGALLTGNRDEVLRNGETKGFAKMVVGDDGNEYEVSLSFTEANPRGTLTIKNTSTGMQSNNVSMLQKLFGYQDFDAVEFSRWSETAEGRRKQIAVVKSLLPEAIRTRIDSIDAEVKALKDERTGVNRDVKTYTAVCENAEKLMAPGDVENYAEPVDVAALVKAQSEIAALDVKAQQIQAAKIQREKQLAEIPERMRKVDEILTTKKAEIKASVAAAKAAYDKAVADASVALGEWEKAHETEIVAIEAERKDYETRKANAEKWLADYEKAKAERTDVATALANAEEHNRKNRMVADYLAKKADRDNAVERAEQMDEKITTLTDERAELIANAKLPIKGLSFSDDGLELNGVPFVPGKVSDSQTMEVATKLVIISNPKVKVFRIARGESLGQKRLENIIAIAKKYGFQGFVENVVRGQQEMAIEEYTEPE